MELSSRQRRILIKTVELYIATGSPVSSGALTESVDASSSTIRAELNQLESLGLLTHPHTSAGRVPTDAGYRYYVNTLMTGERPRDGLFETSADSYGNLDELLRGISEDMSRVTRLLAVVAGPGMLGDTVTSVDCVVLRPNTVLLIISMESGVVSSSVVTLPERVRDEELREIVQALNGWIGGRYLDPDLELDLAARRLLSDYNPDVVQAVMGTIEALARSEDRGLFVRGASALLARLDDLDSASLAAIVEIFERRRWLLHVLERALERSNSCTDVVVAIGSESGFYKLSNTSLVAAAYQVNDRPYGVVSLIGPKRMDYDSAISTVRSAAETLTDRLSTGF
ncbi:heat-inducible transcription repressor HrcA [Rubrobacter taiwanensis]|jgi:heat-inducible transcriptional repressor|uniref:Heat-inducible transcription repressor HrcA n=1 Tax=Rubrobacter taiwanensis TaxID=185139 RepID=A0A4R1BJ29_9ACTN|nr:heat-inducible transcriptional repressor HrcA [Rubrobacter taiwanensis]TCJ17320.1 heat-inducible transcription repressor HrcA [Rubrobacter taiwanensis]